MLCILQIINYHGLPRQPDSEFGVQAAGRSGRGCGCRLRLQESEGQHHARNPPKGRGCPDSMVRA